MALDITHYDFFKTLADFLGKLEGYLASDESNDLKCDAVICRFKFCIELFWKVLKNILVIQKIEAFTPGEVMQKAYQVQLIDNESIWITMLKDKNIMSGVYSEHDVYEIFKRIKHEYVYVMKNTYRKLKDELVK